MPTQRKLEQVALLEDRLQRATITIGLDYRGLRVAQMQGLRRALRDKAPESELRVIKNTLLRRAALNTGKPELIDVVEEATALLFGFGEVVAPPKALRDYLRESRLDVTVRGAYLDGAVLSGPQVTELADVPSQPELMAKLAGGLNSPIVGIAGSISSIIREVAAIVEARAAQLEEQGGAPAATEAPAEASVEAAGESASNDEDTAPEAKAGAETESSESAEDGEA